MISRQKHFVTTPNAYNIENHLKKPPRPYYVDSVSRCSGVQIVFYKTLITILFTWPERNVAVYRGIYVYNTLRIGQLKVVQHPANNTEF